MSRYLNYPIAHVSLFCLPAVLFGLICSSCAKETGWDDDAINRRSFSRDMDTNSELPDPAKVSAEARKVRDLDGTSREGSLRGVEGEVVIESDSGEGLSSVAAAYAEIYVPKESEEQSFFAPVKNAKSPEKNRRKPIFLGKLGIKAILADAPLAQNTGSIATLPGIMTMAARSKPGTVKPQEGMGTYIVQKGDTLSVISVRLYKTSGRWMELAHLNKLGNGSVIYPNELLIYIPDRPK